MTIMNVEDDDSSKIMMMMTAAATKAVSSTTMTTMDSFLNPSAFLPQTSLQLQSTSLSIINNNVDNLCNNNTIDIINYGDRLISDDNFIDSSSSSSSSIPLLNDQVYINNNNIDYRNSTTNQLQQQNLPPVISLFKLKNFIHQPNFKNLLNTNIDNNDNDHSQNHKGYISLLDSGVLNECANHFIFNIYQ